MNMKTFGKNIRVIRSILDMSAAEFGAAIGLTRQAINNYESGRAIPKMTIKMAIIGYLYQQNEKSLYDIRIANLLRECFTREVTMHISYE